MLIYNNQLYKKFYLLSKQPNAIRVEISEITNPTIDTLKKIAKALKVKVSDLLEEEYLLMIDDYGLKLGQIRK